MLFPEAYRLEKERFSLGILALLKGDQGQPIECLSHTGMLWPQLLLPDPQSLEKEALRLGILALLREKQG
jgi:hypothetical protein